METGKDAVVYAVLPPARIFEQLEVSAQRPAGAPEPGIKATVPPQTGGNVEIPRMIRPLRPKYPPGAAGRGIEGTLAGSMKTAPLPLAAGAARRLRDEGLQRRSGRRLRAFPAPGAGAIPGNCRGMGPAFHTEARSAILSTTFSGD